MVKFGEVFFSYVVFENEEACDIAIKELKAFQCIKKTVFYTEKLRRDLITCGKEMPIISSEINITST